MQDYLTIILESHNTFSKQEELNKYFFQNSIEAHNQLIPHHIFYTRCIITLIKAEKILKRKEITNPDTPSNQVYIHTLTPIKNISYLVYNTDIIKFKKSIFEAYEYTKEKMCFHDGWHSQENKQSLIDETKRYLPIIFESQLIKYYTTIDDFENEKVITEITNKCNNDNLDLNKLTSQLSDVLKDIDILIPPKIIKFFMIILMDQPSKKQKSILAQTFTFIFLFTAVKKKYLLKIEATKILNILLNGVLVDTLDAFETDIIQTLKELIIDFELNKKESIKSIKKLIKFTETAEDKYHFTLGDAKVKIINHLQVLKNVLQNHDFENNEKAPVLIENTSDENTPNKNALLFRDPNTKSKFYDILKGVFPEHENSLLDALHGQRLNSPLVFNSNQNKLVELFKRAKYNGVIISSYDEINTWLCNTFCFKYKRGTINELRPFNQESIKNIFKKGHLEVPKSKRICIDEDFLPHIPISKRNS